MVSTLLMHSNKPCHLILPLARQRRTRYYYTDTKPGSQQVFGSYTDSFQNG